MECGCHYAMSARGVASLREEGVVRGSIYLSIYTWVLRVKRVEVFLIGVNLRSKLCLLNIQLVILSE